MDGADQALVEIMVSMPIVRVLQKMMNRVEVNVMGNVIVLDMPFQLMIILTFQERAIFMFLKAPKYHLDGRLLPIPTMILHPHLGTLT